MGTNYFAQTLEHGEIHLCKLSAGWVPTVHATGHYDDWTSFRAFVENEAVVVRNEYGDVLGKAEFLDKLDDRRQRQDLRRQPCHSDVSHRADGLDFIGGWFR